MKKNLLVILLWLASSPATMAYERSFHVLDVGEGQAVLLRNNDRAILIDPGHAGAAIGVLKRIESLAINHLDYLILTHLHPDHSSGYFRIHEAFSGARVLDSCHPDGSVNTLDIVRWVNEALNKNTRRSCVKKGDQFNWQSFNIRFLWPNTRPESNSGLNHTSLVTLIESEETALLIMGDADAAAEKIIMETQTLPDIDVLVAGHHGSKHANSESWMKQIRPQISVVSVNKNNIRHYPSAKTLDILARYSNRVFVTAQEGEFVFQIER